MSRSHREYWSEARRPVASLYFVLPMLAAYEILVLWLGGSHADQLRNGADHWLRMLCLHLPLAGSWFAPLMVAGVLIAWQRSSSNDWNLSGSVLTGMCAESFLFAILLVLFGQHWPQLVAWATPQEAAPLLSWGHWSNCVTYLGAGLYEEFLFRLCLLTLLWRGLLLANIPGQIAFWMAAVTAAAVFAVAHYLPAENFAGVSAWQSAFKVVLVQPSMWTGCSFRFVAGMVFAALVRFRGFGIAVGTHVFYDLIVGTWMLSLAW